MLTLCCSFSVKATHVVPRAYVTDNDPLVGEDIRRREERCRKSGGIGTAVIIIQCGEVSQVMPVEVDAPGKISWDARADWEDVLRHFVDAARTDFKPISTTARGCVACFCLYVAVVADCDVQGCLRVNVHWPSFLVLDCPAADVDRRPLAQAAPPDSRSPRTLRSTVSYPHPSSLSCTIALLSASPAFDRASPSYSSCNPA